MILPGLTGGITGVVHPELELVAITGLNQQTIDIPSTAKAGDLAVLADMVWSAISTTSVTPSGWTTPANGDSGNGSHRMVVSYKILGGGDPGATITGMNEENERKVMGVFRLRDGRPITSVTVLDCNVDAAGGNNPAQQTVTPVSGARPILGLGFAAHEFGVSDFSVAPTWDGNQTAAGGDTVRLAYKFFQNGEPPADFSVDIGDMGNHNFLGSMAIRVS